MSRVLNVNIGVLGHVDSGKTSLCRSLSTTASTASFDKSPQSQERGITLDLGFSCINVPSVPPHLQGCCDAVQITLVDCPGHASLIRTVMSGAQIIESMLLVIDATKGIQPQTGECIVLGEILKKPVIVVVNKADLLMEEQPDKLDLLLKKLKKTFLTATETENFRTAPIVCVSAKTGHGLPKLLDLITARISIDMAARNRLAEEGLLFAYDHCFLIKGQGTVLTGTVLSGTMSLGQSVCVVENAQQRKIKSLQRFRQQLETALPGDRVGMCLTNLPPENLERGLVVRDPSNVERVKHFIMSAQRIKHHKRALASGLKMHISLLHSTVIGTVYFFRGQTEQLYLEEMPAAAVSGTAIGPASGGDDVFVYVDVHHLNENNLVLPTSSSGLTDRISVISSRLEAGASNGVSECRLAFHGHVVQVIHDPTTELSIHKRKTREGAVDRVNLVGPRTVQIIGKDMFKKDADIGAFEGCSIAVMLPSSEQPLPSRGRLEGSFGKSGKFKVGLDLDQDVDDAFLASLRSAKLQLHFRKLVFAESRKYLPL